jgi:hypothetical protein
MDEINWDGIAEVIPATEVEKCMGSDILTSITSQVELLIRNELASCGIDNTNFSVSINKNNTPAGNNYSGSVNFNFTDIQAVPIGVELCDDGCNCVASVKADLSSIKKLCGVDNWNVIIPKIGTFNAEATNKQLAVKKVLSRLLEDKKELTVFGRSYNRDNIQLLYNKLEINRSASIKKQAFDEDAPDIDEEPKNTDWRENRVCDRDFTYDGINISAKKNSSGWCQWSAEVEVAPGIIIEIGDDEGGEISCWEIVAVIDKLRDGPVKFITGYDKKWLTGGMNDEKTIKDLVEQINSIT